MNIFLARLVDIGQPAPAVISYFDNVEGATILGADWNLVFNSQKGFQFSLNGNYNQSEYKADHPGYSGIQEGDRINLVPELTVGAAASYTIPLGEKLEGLVLANVQHSSERSNIADGITYESDPLTIINARLGVQAKNFGIFLFGKNLLNEDGAVFRNQSHRLTDDYVR